MTDIEEIIREIVTFRDERDWKQFHNGKDLALALSIEAAELNELFLWKNPEDVSISDIKAELADVLNYAFLIAHKYDLDIKEIMLDKIISNGEKYPVSKSKGNAQKYDKL